MLHIFYVGIILLLLHYVVARVKIILAYMEDIDENTSLALEKALEQVSICLSQPYLKRQTRFIDTMQNICLFQKDLV